MQKRRNIFSIIVNTAVFIILEIAALTMLNYSSPVQNFFLTKGFHAIQGKLWGVTESVSSYFSLKEENSRLAGQIFDLNRQIEALNRQLDNKILDSLSAGYTNIPDSKFDFIPANVIKNNINKQHNYIILGKGSKDGISAQSGVITPEGVVGIVDAVSRNYSYVISLLNSEINISARIGNSGAAGPMSWDGMSSNRAILKEIPLQYKFEEGDTVYTSGYSSIFPPDIPLGVTGKTKIVNGATYDVKVHLFQDFTSLRYVTVVKNRDILEIDELEQHQESKKEKK